jgi:hypothetical protein
MCGGSSEDVQVGERALESAGFTVDHGAPGIRSSFGHVALQVSNFNEATPEAAKAFLGRAEARPRARVQRVWTQALVDANDQIPLDAVNAAFQGLVLQRSRRLSRRR